MGLYDDDKSAVTSGDVLDVLYWQTRFQYDKLEDALKTKQPESQFRMLVAGVVNGCNDVLKEYPNHEDVKKWKAKAESIGAKLDPNAPPADFKGNFAQYRDYAYEAGWRSYNIAKMAAAAEDWTTCLTHAREAVAQLGRAEGRMAEWSEDVKKWISASKTEMEAMEKQAAGKR